MKIKINTTLEVILLFLLAISVAGTVAYWETQRLTAHFMQVRTMETISYAVPSKESKPIASSSRSSRSSWSSTVSVARRILTPRPFKVSEKTAFEVAMPTRKPVAKTVITKPAAPEADNFPAFEKAIYPVNKAPNWGAMRTPAQWERIYGEMNADDFVSIPAYNISRLTVPMNSLTRDLTPENMQLITEKLFYSTRFFGRYHLDSGEYEGRHVGIDIKLAAGTPIFAIAGGMVHATGTDEALGNYVMIEHRLPTDEAVISIYGHLDTIGTTEGTTVKPGTIIGYAGSTGRSESAHLHLQVDIKKNPGRHSLYVPGSDVSAAETSKWTLHPIEFIAQW